MPNIWLVTCIRIPFAITIFQSLKFAITIHLIGNLPLQFSFTLNHAIFYTWRVSGPITSLRIYVCVRIPLVLCCWAHARRPSTPRPWLPVAAEARHAGRAGDPTSAEPITWTSLDATAASGPSPPEAQTRRRPHPEETLPPSVTASPTHHHNPASMADSVIWSAGSSPPLPENKTVEAGESKLMPCPKKRRVNWCWRISISISTFAMT